MKNKKIWYEKTYIASFAISLITFIFRFIHETFLICNCGVLADGRICSNDFCYTNLSNTLYSIYNFTLYYYDWFLLLFALLSIVMLLVNIIKRKKVFIIMSIIGIVFSILAIYRLITYIPNIKTYKPIIYIYPQREINLKIRLGNKKKLTHTYPKYNNEWNVKVSTDGNIYDYKTNRNYYALYWEGIDDSIIDESEGFLVQGSDTTNFLEEKLEYLGLNEREIEEFIIYWLPKLENNKYNYIRFRTTDEVNKYMPLYVNKEPDTLIRIIMDFKPLNNKIKIKEQKLVKQERKGFTIIEWGGRILN